MGIGEGVGTELTIQRTAVVNRQVIGQHLDANGGDPARKIGINGPGAIRPDGIQQELGRFLCHRM